MAAVRLAEPRQIQNSRNLSLCLSLCFSLFLSISSHVPRIFRFEIQSNEGIKMDLLPHRMNQIIFSISYKIPYIVRVSPLSIVFIIRCARLPIYKNIFFFEESD